jgi:hypothetical protein
MSDRPGFREALECLLNQHSKENGSDTPDFILAEYLAGCLNTFDIAVRNREKWYGRPQSGPAAVAGPLPPPEPKEQDDE